MIQQLLEVGVRHDDGPAPAGCGRARGKAVAAGAQGGKPAVRTKNKTPRRQPDSARGKTATGVFVPPGGAVPFDDAHARYSRKLNGVAAVYVSAARARGWAADLDDALQVARMALWECWRRDPTCGRGFSSLVEKAAHRRLTNWLRRQVPMIRGRSGGDAGPPAAVYSLDALMEADPLGWEERVRPLGEEE